MEKTRFLNKLLILSLFLFVVTGCEDHQFFNDNNYSQDRTIATPNGTKSPITGDVKSDLEKLKTSFDSFQNSYKSNIKNLLSEAATDGTFSKNQLQSYKLQLQDLVKLSTLYKDFKKSYVSDRSNLNSNIQEKIKSIEPSLKEIESILWPLFGALDDSKPQNDREQKIREIQEKVNKNKAQINGKYKITTNKNVDRDINKQLDAIDLQLKAIEGSIQDKTAIKSNKQVDQNKPINSDGVWQFLPFILVTSALTGAVSGISAIMLFLLYQHHIEEKKRNSSGQSGSQPPDKNSSSSTKSRKQLSDRDHAFLFTYVNRILETNGIDTNNFDRTQQVDPPDIATYSKEEIEFIVKAYLDTHLDRLVSSQPNNFRQLPPSTELSPEETIEQLSTQTEPIRTSIDGHAQIYNQYNEVAKNYFLHNAQELKETQASVDRKYSVSPSEIELQSVNKNQGSFWVFQENSQGWLFPKIGGIRQGDWNAVKTLFDVGNVSTQNVVPDHTRIEVIRPALLKTSKNQLWTLQQKGHIVLK